jgi:AraC family transcriptional regulator of adaptative response / DNA-3-methyladenine glycosylase II
VPRTVDGPELAVRAVLGQQVSTAAARTHAGRLVAAHGTPVDDPDGGLTHLFPDVPALARVDTDTLALPRSRRRTMAALVAALVDGRLDLDPAADPARAKAVLGELPGFGPWTVETVTMRALADPDAFLPTDLGVVLAARRLGLPGTPAALGRYAERWRPWRSYAVQYLWATGEHAVNRLPVDGP